MGCAIYCCPADRDDRIYAVERDLDAMGSGSSKALAEPAIKQPPAVVETQGQLIEPEAPTLLTTRAATPYQPHGGGRGKHTKAKKWQIELDGQWQDYEDQEDRILKRAYLVGQPNARFHLRGQDYEYNFRKMRQKNLKTHKERQIRPPPGPRPPKHALLPTGPMVIITVGTGQPGQMITVPDPNNPGSKINVFVPPGAKPGSKMAVPIPLKGESIQAVYEKQKKHDEKREDGKWSTGGKMAAGGAALVGVGAIGVGGVILGDALAGGDMAGEIGSALADGAEAVGDSVTDAAEAIADWAPGAAEDLGEFAGDAVDWLGDAGEDIGDFIMDLF